MLMQLELIKVLYLLAQEIYLEFPMPENAY